MVSKKDIKAIANLFTKYQEEYDEERERNKGFSRPSAFMKALISQTSALSDVVEVLDINQNDIYRVQRGEPI